MHWQLPSVCWRIVQWWGVRYPQPRARRLQPYGGVHRVSFVVGGIVVGAAGGATAVSGASLTLPAPPARRRCVSSGGHLCLSDALDSAGAIHKDELLQEAAKYLDIAYAPRADTASRFMKRRLDHQRRRRRYRTGWVCGVDVWVKGGPLRTTTLCARRWASRRRRLISASIAMIALRKRPISVIASQTKKILR